MKEILDFVLLFTGILWEAMPFIVLGAVVAGVLEEMLPQQWLTKFLPKRVLPAVVIGGLLGLAFPMCECGIVVVMRRLLRKGLPLSCCIAYMLAGPIVNGVVIFSTAVAFGPHGIAREMVGMRVGLGFLTAVMTALVVHRQYAKYGNSLLTAVAAPPSVPVAALPMAGDTPAAGEPPAPKKSAWKRINNITSTALHDFVDITVFLILGAVLAALVKGWLSGSGFSPEKLSQEQPYLAVPAMMLLAVLMCLCSEADAFVAASFTNMHLSAKLGVPGAGADAGPETAAHVHPRLPPPADRHHRGVYRHPGAGLLPRRPLCVCGQRLDRPARLNAHTPCTVSPTRGAAMAHDHDHGHHDADSMRDYFTEQLLTILVVGLFGFAAVRMYSNGMLELILAPAFRLPVFIGGAVVLLLVAVRAVCVWQESGTMARASGHDRDHGHDHQHHEPGHVHGPDCDHDHAHTAAHVGHDHDHDHADHGHSHDLSWVFARMLVLMFPVALFFLGVPNQGFSKDYLDKLIGNELALGLDNLKDVAGKDGSLTRFDDLKGAEYDADRRDALTGVTAELEGRFRQLGPKEFTLFRLKRACCATDSVALKVRISVPTALGTFQENEWVTIKGQVQFVQVPGTEQYVSVIKVMDITDVRKKKGPQRRVRVAAPTFHTLIPTTESQRWTERHRGRQIAIV